MTCLLTGLPTQVWAQPTNSSLAAGASPAIRYEVAFNSAPLHMVDVIATVATNGRDIVEWYLPTWTPGSYLVREYARHIQEIQAIDPATGRTLPMTKSRKNRWTVTTGSAAAVQLRYRVYGYELSVRTNFVDQDWALINGAATFLTIAADRDQPHQVRYVLPPGWSQVVTELPAVDNAATTFMAETYDALVDAPAVAGSPSIASFEVGGKTHRLVCIGDDDLWNASAAAKDLRRLVEIEQQFWGVVPYECYTFFNVIGESGGGLEHDNSTVLMTSRWSQALPERYRKWLSLCSHEFFHTWNVRRLRPRTLMRYDYENEQLFPELWIAEGITSYYDDLLVRRAELMMPKQYLESLSDSIGSVQSAPGRNVQSLRDSSTDSWIKHYRPDENSVNSQISYYTKGLLVAWLLDAEIRISTQGKKSLDDVMRILYQEHMKTGYTGDDFRAVAAKVAGKDLSSWFVENVDQAGELDFSAAMAHFGLHWSDQDDPTTAKDTDADKELTGDDDPGEPATTEAADADEDSPKWDLGLSTREQGGRVTITSVRHGGPAALAGLSVDDELIAMEGYRVSRTNLSDQLDVLMRSNGPVELVIARRGKILERAIQPIPKAKRTWKLKLDANPSEDILRNRNQWLGIAGQ